MATRSKRKAMDDLAVVNAQLAVIEEKLTTLQNEFKEATQEKAKYEMIRCCAIQFHHATVNDNNLLFSLSQGGG